MQVRQDLISFFSVLARPAQALESQDVKRGFMNVLIGAFFIVMAGTMVLNWFQATFHRAGVSEKTAFEPSQLISQEITRGYFGVRL